MVDSGETAMPITDPTKCHDRVEDWTAFFNAQRIKTLKPTVTTALIEEFNNNPRGYEGRRSDDLHRLLTFIRNIPIEGKSFVYAEKPGESYRIGILSGRGKPPRFDDERRFANEADAVRAVFMQRLTALGLVDEPTG
jgi:hypothetical protein